MSDWSFPVAIFTPSLLINVCHALSTSKLTCQGPNMIRWLASLDPNKKSYFGSEVVTDGTRFAHGGTGIVLSRASMYETAVIHNGTAAAWDIETTEECCGDLVLGRALKQHGTELQDAWPLMSGETHWSMPFGPATPEYWCRPVISLHHLSPADMKEFSGFEHRRSKTAVSSC